jgi:hypothetical protein
MKEERENRVRDFSRKLRDMAEEEGFFAIVALQDEWGNFYAAHTSGFAEMHRNLIDRAARALSKSIEEEEDE